MWRSRGMFTAKRAAKTWTTTGACCTRCRGMDRGGRPALGDSLISVQERFNTLSNLQMETYEYGIPPIYADSEVLDFDSLQNQTAEPGSHYPARAKPGAVARFGIFPAGAGGGAGGFERARCGADGPVAQFLTGAFPALFGGAMSNNDTASGYAMAREQAMGRIGLVVAEDEIFPRGHHVAGGGLFPEEPVRTTWK